MDINVLQKMNHIDFVIEQYSLEYNYSLEILSGKAVCFHFE